MLDQVFEVTCVRIPRRKAYYVKFLYNEQFIKNIKLLPPDTRKWSPELIAWEITTMSLLNLMKIYKGSNKIYFNFGNDDSRKVFVSQVHDVLQEEKEKKKLIDDLNSNKENWLKYKLELDHTYEKYVDKMQSYLKPGTNLFPHQVTSALFMNVTKNTLVSHEMGLGKTLESILYVEMNDYQKVLVITPNSLKFNYYDEVEKFTIDSKAHIVNWGKNGKKNKYTIEESKYIIINYDFFNNSTHSIEKFNKLNIGQIDVLICDECQKLKNSKANIYKNFSKIFKDTIFKNSKPSKIFLSGTPSPNRAHEIYNVLHQISPIDFANKKYFMSYYCGMTYDFNNGWGYVTDTAEQKLEELFNKIAPYTHRKRKIDVLNLPSKTYQKIMLEMNNNDQKTYDEIEEGAVNEFISNPTKSALVIMLRLRQFTSHLKIDPVLELIENILYTGEKVVVVDYFKDSLNKLKEKLGDIAVLHTGDFSVEERSEMVKSFQDPNSNIKVFLGSIQTCSYGVTLTAASKMLIISLPYSYGEYSQVSDRIHRISTMFPVNIYSIIFKDSIDCYVWDLIQSKTKELIKVLDNEDYSTNTNESAVYDIIKKLKEKHKK